jgi:hypothetical protein
LEERQREALVYSAPCMGGFGSALQDVVHTESHVTLQAAIPLSRHHLQKDEGLLESGIAIGLNDALPTPTEPQTEEDSHADHAGANEEQRRGFRRHRDGCVNVGP